MAADPFHDTEERGKAGRPGTWLLRNADPSTDPNGNVHRLATAAARRPSRPAAMPAPAQAGRDPGEMLGRVALVVLFALTVSLAVVFLVVSYAGEPDATAAGELATGARPEPLPLEVAATPPPVPRPATDSEAAPPAPLPTPAPQPSAAADPPPRAAVPPPTPMSETAGMTLTAADIRTLRLRGEALFNTGDVAAARPLFERAARAGDDVAALRLGQSYDPAYLAGARGHGVTGNPGLAIFWYRRGQDLGNGTAAFLARQLETAARARWRP